MRLWMMFFVGMWTVVVNALEVKPQISSLSLVVSGDAVADETYRFREFGGSLDDAGLAMLTIDLASFDSGDATRDQRVRKMFFDTDRFPKMVFLTSVNMTSLTALGAGQQMQVPVKGRLTFGGKSVELQGDVQVTRLVDGGIQIASLKPVPLNVDDFDLGKNLRKLMKIGDRDIHSAVPISFSLVFAP